MKIGFSSLAFDGGQSGISSYIIGLLKGLSKVDQQNSYDIFCLEEDKGALDFKRDNFHLNAINERFSSPISSILWHNTTLPKLGKKAPYDLVHIPTIRRIPLIKGCPVIATVHDLAPFRLPHKYDALRGFYHRQILCRLLHNVDHVITVSESTKRDIIEFTGYSAEKISVIYSGIDHTLFYPGDLVAAQAQAQACGIDKPFILYVSRLEHPGKNHIGLIEAYNRLRDKKLIDHQLVFVGARWSGVEKVDQAIEKSPYKNDIISLGFTCQKLLQALVRSTDLMIFPSLYEGFGLPAIEALASGTKVACSNIASLKELIDGYGHLFDPTDIEDMSQAILKSLENPLSDLQLERQLAYAKTFNWKSCAQNVLNVYQAFNRCLKV